MRLSYMGLTLTTTISATQYSVQFQQHTRNAGPETNFSAGFHTYFAFRPSRSCINGVRYLRYVDNTDQQVKYFDSNTFRFVQNTDAIVDNNKENTIYIHSEADQKLVQVIFDNTT